MRSAQLCCGLIGSSIVFVEEASQRERLSAMEGLGDESLLAASAVVLTVSLCGIYYLHRARSLTAAPASASTGARADVTDHRAGPRRAPCVTLQCVL
jgi:hypothetical protein